MVLPIIGASQATPSTLADNPVYSIKDQLNEHIFPAGSLAAAQQLVGPYTRILESIEIKTKPTKIEYSAGEAMDWKGLSVIGTFSDGSTKEYTSTSSEVTLDPPAGATLGVSAGYRECRVTVKVGSVSKTASFTVKVKDDVVRVTGITTDVPDGKLSIEAGKTATFGVEVLPSNASNKIYEVVTSDWCVQTSVHPGYVTVTGANPGSATLVVRSVDGGYTAKVAVTVTAAV